MTVHMFCFFLFSWSSYFQPQSCGTRRMQGRYRIPCHRDFIMAMILGHPALGMLSSFETIFAATSHVMTAMSVWAARPNCWLLSTRVFLERLRVEHPFTSVLSSKVCTSWHNIIVHKFMHHSAQNIWDLHFFSDKLEDPSQTSHLIAQTKDVASQRIQSAAFLKMHLVQAVRTDRRKTIVFLQAAGFAP